MSKIDFKNMTGEQLFDFYSNTEGEGVLFDLIYELPLSIGDAKETYLVLEKIHKEDKTPVAVYDGDSSPENAEFVCEITDGALFLT